jgi:hypothetical protein
MIQVAARGKQDRTRAKVKLAEVASFLVRKPQQIGAANNPTVTSAEDKLSLTEGPQREHPQSLLARITYDDV